MQLLGILVENHPKALSKTEFLDAMKGSLGERVFEAALAEGRTMSLSRAIQFGLEDGACDQHAPSNAITGPRTRP